MIHTVGVAVALKGFVLGERPGRAPAHDLVTLVPLTHLRPEAAGAQLPEGEHDVGVDVALVALGVVMGLVDRDVGHHAARDELLGTAPGDRDWVAVGATPEQLIAAGYTPVGREFPVFLHPQTHEEVALARTERKTAPGYHGFVFHAAPDVSLEQDLARRDLTINAMATTVADFYAPPFTVIGAHDPVPIGIGAEPLARLAGGRTRRDVVADHAA